MTKQDYKITELSYELNSKSILIKGNKFNLYDLNGSRTIRESYWKNFSEKNAFDALIYVLDASDIENRSKL